MDFNMVGRFFRRLSKDADLLGSEFEQADAVAKAAGEGSFTTKDAVMKTARSAYGKALPHGGEEADQWNRKDHGTTTPGLRTGPQQSASGSGASKMSEDYSEPAEQGALVEALNALSDKLDRQTSRIEASEKAIAALASFIAKDSNARFPEDEEEDDREDEGDEESDAAEKSHFVGRPRTASVPQFLDRLSRRSKSPAPPDFTTRKSNPVCKPLNELMLDKEMSLADSLAAKDFLSRYHAFERGMIPVNAVLKAAPPHEVAVLIDQSAEGRDWRARIDQMNRRAA